MEEGLRVTWSHAGLRPHSTRGAHVIVSDSDPEVPMEESISLSWCLTKVSVWPGMAAGDSGLPGACPGVPAASAASSQSGKGGIYPGMRANLGDWGHWELM